jgi:uncharacterized membrane protein YtjA (UPF0391 family)
MLNSRSAAVSRSSDAETSATKPVLTNDKEEAAMISWAITFFIISLIAAVLGLRGVAGLSAEMGYLFAVLAVVFLVIALLTGHSVAPVS